MSSEGYHEPYEILSGTTKERHRAIVSLIEELEAIDWYQQRAEACSDAELREVLLHHMREEVEHAMMNLEWLRRNDAVFAEKIAVYIDSRGPIVGVEAAEEAGAAGASEGGGAKAGARVAAGSLGIGSLKGA
jgi:ferritin-like protein